MSDRIPSRDPAARMTDKNTPVALPNLAAIQQSNPIDQYWILSMDLDKAIPLYSGQFYGACAMGGTLACGVTHWFVTPLDLVKCRRQVLHWC